MDRGLSNFIKYCLGYVKITRQRTFVAQQKYSANLPKENFGLIGLLNGETDGSLAELINLDCFYSYDPNDVTEVNRENYEKEKALANKIEDIYNKHKNDQFTKQVILNFGYFEIEVPIEIEEDSVDAEQEDLEATRELYSKIDSYPLFSLPVRIEKEIEKGVGRYFIYSVDPDVQVNVGILEAILGEDLYFQLVQAMGQYEIDGRLTLPITGPDTFVEIWHKIKAQLRLKDAKFDENSFSLEEMRIALSPRANYFLAEDLQKLSKLSEEDLKDTALTSWVEDDELSSESELCHEKDLYFPFQYDKYQLGALKIINNKAAIIQGPPGTGKSETIANLLCHLTATGNRVLFVSQKAQALKVVKDKLKKLEVKYLFGYLPNPNSAQIGEEDEIDGIAPQLTALDSHIEKLNYMTQGKGKSSVESLGPIIEQKTKLRESVNSVIASQRKYYQLYQELISLQDCNVPITDISRFAEGYSLARRKEIRALIDAIQFLTTAVIEYEATEQKKQIDNLFISVKLTGTRYGEAIRTIKEDVASSGYDRHLKLGRMLNNALRNIRLKKTRAELPREIIDCIDQELSGGISRNQGVQYLTSLYNHCAYYENIDEVKLSAHKLRTKLLECGISRKEFDLIDLLHRVGEPAEPDNVKQKILRVYEIKKALKELEQAKNINSLVLELRTAEKIRSGRIGSYIQNIINANIIKKSKQGAPVRRIINKLAKAFGQSKKAFKTFDRLRKDPDNFDVILDLIPVWIIELDDASRIIPLKAGIFDYVILDEASQCNVAYTLPVMYRSKRALFVGDSEQMRDNTIMFKSNRAFDELAHRYQIPEDLQIKATAAAVQSVLDIASLRGLSAIPLRYHYRSPSELIGFSNKCFYKPKGKDLIPLNNNYLTYKDTNRIMLVHQINSDGASEISDKINIAEANAILDLFRQLKSDERYQDKSVGILAFFNAQAAYIRQLFALQGYKEEKDNYKVSIIEGIQGDEKDIILYSFVIRTPDQRNKYIPLTGEGGDIRGDINRGRVNVAFSRARLQVHCFISLPIEQVPERIWIKRYLKYAEDNGEVNFYSNDLKPFDSNFEKEFCGLLRGELNQGYKIQNQVESCGFKIDFVVSNTQNSRRLAVECDGPTHFKDELDEEYGIYVDSDEERQRVLEAAGWEFYRLKYSDWIKSGFSRKSVAEEIIRLLS
jgi:very-short-patch-repair endonuclease